MSVRRALVHCVVLSLQDTCVFYPCCKGCFSRINVEQQDTTRYRCSRCGYMCLREHVEYRYRLSLRVIRDRCIFGVTVFGNSLNQFFGIHASGLQKLVEIESSTRSTLFVKAIKDCFIGRHFIFAIKLNGAENGRLFEGILSNASNIIDTSQLIASQMILPQSTSLAGCTVVRYYQRLLQKALELERDCSKPCGPPASLFLIPSQSPTSSFGDSTLFASGNSHSLLTSKHHDCSVSPTPPWQQSLGLVTSSAEQEEDCSTHDSQDENSRHKDNSTASFPAEESCLKSRKVTEEKTPLFLLDDSNSSVKNVGNSLSVNTWCRASQPVQESCSFTQKGFYSQQHTRTHLSNSLLWEDLPFSESLSEFLCEENKNVDVGGETGPNLNVNCQNKIPETFLENKELAVGLTSTNQRKVKITSNSSTLLDVTNAASPDARDGHDLCDQACETPVKCRKLQEARNITSDEFVQEDGEASLCFKEEEQHEGDSYNCSADLFGSTFTISMNTDMLSMDANTDKPISKTDCQRLLNKSLCVSPVAPQKWEIKAKRRNSLIPQETHDFEFIPPSQSTPVLKAHLAKSPSFKNLNESTKETVTHSLTFSRQSHRLSPKKKSRKPDECKMLLQVGRHVKLQKRNLNMESVNILNPKHDVQASQMPVCNLEEDEGIVAPTPAGKTQLSVSLRRRRHADLSTDDLGFPWKGREDDCKRCVFDPTFTPSHRGLSQKGETGNETAFEATDASNDELVDDENQSPDWSRDLFSDSI